jgi:hypothetical protein
MGRHCRLQHRVSFKTVVKAQLNRGGRQLIRDSQHRSLSMGAPVGREPERHRSRSSQPRSQEFDEFDGGFGGGGFSPVAEIDDGVSEEDAGGEERRLSFKEMTKNADFRRHMVMLLQETAPLQRARVHTKRSTHTTRLSTFVNAKINKNDVAYFRVGDVPKTFAADWLDFVQNGIHEVPTWSRHDGRARGTLAKLLDAVTLITAACSINHERDLLTSGTSKIGDALPDSIRSGRLFVVDATPNLASIRKDNLHAHRAKQLKVSQVSDTTTSMHDQVVQLARFSAMVRELMLKSASAQEDKTFEEKQDFLLAALAGYGDGLALRIGVGQCKIANCDDQNATLMVVNGKVYIRIFEKKKYHMMRPVQITEATPILFNAIMDVVRDDAFVSGQMIAPATAGDDIVALHDRLGDAVEIEHCDVPNILKLESERSKALHANYMRRLHVSLSFFYFCIDWMTADQVVSVLWYQQHSVNMANDN